jgi:hypothetical protein
MILNTKQQIKSKKRVTDHGEVLTAEREVKAMLDLVKSESERIESRFLEPACGDGNFLAEILHRKLNTVLSRYNSNPLDFEKYSVLAVSSIYGVDILPDNVLACQNRMFYIFDTFYSLHCKGIDKEDCRQAVQFILSRNIICGDALTMKTNDGNPIIFSEWSIITGDLIKRRDFRLDEMLQGHQKDRDVFMQNWEYDNEMKAFIPLPIREFQPVHYSMVQNYG